jgi:hypothetical protein
LLHGKAVLVETSVDSEDVSLEFLSKSIGFNLLSHTLFEKDSASVIIIDVKRFGGTVGGV